MRVSIFRRTFANARSRAFRYSSSHFFRMKKSLCTCTNMPSEGFEPALMDLLRYYSTGGAVVRARVIICAWTGKHGAQRTTSWRRFAPPGGPPEANILRVRG